MTFDWIDKDDETHVEPPVDVENRARKLKKKAQRNVFITLLGILTVIFVPLLQANHGNLIGFQGSTYFIALTGIVMVYTLLMYLSVSKPLDYFDPTMLKRLEKKAQNVDLAKFTALMFAAFVVINTYFFSFASVEGTSMNPTLSSQEDIIIRQIFVSYDRHDIVVVKIDDDTFYVKRIIGLPGETILIQDGQVYVGTDTLTLIDEPYVTHATPCYSICEWQLGEDEYFVMGDNRLDSLDSRNEELGSVQEEMLLGKVVFRIRPLSVFGKVE